MPYVFLMIRIVLQMKLARELSAIKYYPVRTDFVADLIGASQAFTILITIVSKILSAIVVIFAAIQTFVLVHSQALLMKLALLLVEHNVR